MFYAVTPRLCVPALAPCVLVVESDPMASGAMLRMLTLAGFRTLAAATLAGAYEHLPWSAATADIWLHTYNINVVSGVRMIQRLVPAMRERDYGRVVTIGGGLSMQPFDNHPHYNASLAARHNLAVSLARDLAGTRVTSNVVAPGAILVPAVQEFLTKLSPERGWGETWDEIEYNSVREIVPNDRVRYGRPDEIAGAVAYLCGPYAEYISGATIRVDGGTVRGAF